MEAKKRGDLQRKLSENYSWERIAGLLYRFYLQVLGVHTVAPAA